MRHWSAERGEGNLGCIFWGVVLALVVYVSWVMVPIKIATSQLSDFMEEQALVAAHYSPDAIKKSILRKAEELGLPLDKKKVTVEKRRDYIYMTAEYTVPVEFIGGFVYEWHFEHDISRPVFIV